MEIYQNLLTVFQTNLVVKYCVSEISVLGIGVIFSENSVIQYLILNFHNSVTLYFIPDFLS